MDVDPYIYKSFECNGFDLAFLQEVSNSKRNGENLHSQIFVMANTIKRAELLSHP